MKDLIEITNTGYLINRNQHVCVYCKGNVANIRHFLEHICGFKRDDWNTEDFLNLHWLYVDNLGYVNGVISYNRVGQRIKVSVNNLIKGYTPMLDCKLINLKRK